MSSSVAGSCLGGLFTPATQVFVVFFLRRRDICTDFGLLFPAAQVFESIFLRR